MCQAIVTICAKFHIVSLSAYVVHGVSGRVCSLLVIRGKPCYKTVKPAILLTCSEKILWNHLCSCSSSASTAIIVMETNYCWCWRSLVSPLMHFFVHLPLHQDEMPLSSLKPPPLGQHLDRDEEALGGSVEVRAALTVSHHG